MLGTAIVFMLAAVGLGFLIYRIAVWFDCWSDDDHGRRYRRRHGLEP